MFFTLSFSPDFMNIDEPAFIKNDFPPVVVLMVAFSITFIIFTTVSFTKYRGKEFGVYFTIGLTWKEIIKILFYENIIISLVSFVLASVVGSVFSKLFQMAIWKILNVDSISIALNFRVYGAIILISFSIFLFTSLYQMFFLKKYSIASILKSKSKRDVGSTSTALGILGIVILIISVITINISFGNFYNNGGIITYSIIGLIIAIYLLIGYFMTLISKILKLFKSFYNNNILFVKSLSHRFISYRRVLFVVTLMVAGAITCISIAYSNYKSTEEIVNKQYPYDISFIVDKGQKSNLDIKDITFSNIEGVKKYIELEGINMPDIRISEDKCKVYGSKLLVISEESYKTLGKDALNLKRGEVLFSYADKGMNSNQEGFILDLTNKGIKSSGVSFNSYKEENNSDNYIYIKKENRIDEITNSVNYLANHDYFRCDALVVSNEDYKLMKEKVSDDMVSYDILINVNNNAEFENLKDKLDESLGKKVSNSLTIKKDFLNPEIKENSFLLFVCSFIGIMLLIGSAAVLYFKAMTTIEEDRERSKQLVKLGLTKKEISKLSIQELGIIFLVPPGIALVLVGYLLYEIFSVINDGENLWRYSLNVFIVYSIIQIIFFILTSSKYKRQLNRD
ncbi:ABC transporter permease [Clostridium sp. SHJSY1]|uniref:ABC transporter permease n=1 Tax=Clostridium sp. SHJSY1 TaxID=2942483 RepID=UPI00287B62B7|nr:ABC transporter permease [Clostridium sp. SHJSY1]